MLLAGLPATPVADTVETDDVDPTTPDANQPVPAPVDAVPPESVPPEAVQPDPVSPKPTTVPAPPSDDPGNVLAEVSLEPIPQVTFEEVPAIEDALGPAAIDEIATDEVTDEVVTGETIVGEPAEEIEPAPELPEIVIVHVPDDDEPEWPDIATLPDVTPIPYPFPDDDDDPDVEPEPTEPTPNTVIQIVDGVPTEFPVCTDNAIRDRGKWGMGKRTNLYLLRSTSCNESRF